LPRITPGIKVVAIGASTGGPAVLHKILRELPAGFPVPILVVQHITRGFAVGFVDWLNQACDLQVRLAVNNETAQPGNVYVAPDGFQMKIDTRSRIAVTKDEPENGLRPSVSCLFRSVAQAFQDKAVGILLTGMGRDGAEDLKLMMDKGAVTIAQDEESSIIYGMPQEAVKLGAARYSLPPERITQMLKSLVK
jgi:two-component system chemotaxis response regulator CheB